MSRWRKASPVLMLQIVVPTVRGREHWLQACLSSIRGQEGIELVDLKVSGNGTTPDSGAIARSFGARFVERKGRISAEQHAELLVTEARLEATYCWPIADDDLMAPGALDLVTSAINAQSSAGQNLSALIGRARYFRKDPLISLGDAVPGSDVWVPGSYLTLSDVASATRGEALIGAFVWSTELFDTGDLARYRGTFHALFGGFWDGLARAEQLSVHVVSDAIVFLRAEEKSWDDSRVATLLGRVNFEERLPDEVKSAIPSRIKSLTRKKALTMSVSMRPGQRALVRQLLATYDTVEFGARVIALMPRSVARIFSLLLRLFMGCLDFLYVRAWRS